VLTQIYVLEICPLLLYGKQVVKEQGWTWKDRPGDFCSSLGQGCWWLG